ncbi:hypothetical protein FC18_GL002222 [Lacticaseibacillus sharpeae JCM 1186 = DSM 20505]|uniref:Uncharacterized protein n=1 Tax=Lacticaseibacillus sharpeae JCM 1186 = DSM 20505 TaxID=1291052 RepID=A0A0R1ZK23_9LACO|nr:hypothetical protein FC18_GL002222 [Lacticaseibacillus sharpeae JCM 1186 = DSM 20505]
MWEASNQFQARMMGAPAYFRDDKPVSIGDWIIGGTLIISNTEFRKLYAAVK